MNIRTFKDRTEAGRQLAGELLRYQPDHPLILALPRGGVPVAYEVAIALKAPLDTLVVRKIGAPFDQEFGVGAVAPGDVFIFNDRTLESLELKKEDLDPIVKQELEEMDRRMVHYKSGEYSADALADTVIIVDDGLATGVTARAAIESVLLLQKPRKLVFASPVCSRDTAEELANLVTMVCVQMVDNLIAIGYWYEEFPQTTDEEVVALLERAQSEYLTKSS